MNAGMIYLIAFGIAIYTAIFFVISDKCAKYGGFCFNLKQNYNHWDTLNWFGVWFFTISYWIAFLPFTIIALIYWVLTVGRNQ